MSTRKTMARLVLAQHFIFRLLLLVAVISPVLLVAQPVYTMQNATVDDCEGTLTDSENGPEEGQYNHNENYTFTICVDLATEIIIAFTTFATEETYDYLLVFDGPDTLSTLIGTLTGSIQPPPVFVATSGCITLQFISDDNIVAAGWELNWMVDIDEPEPPSLSVMSVLDCPMDAITFQFDTPVDCELFNASNFTLIGPGSPGIAQVVPLDCMAGEEGQTFEVEFASPLSRPGTYRLLFNGSIQDACGEWHDIHANVVFDLANCPFDVEIHLVDDACAGDCGSVEAVIIGDAGVNYDYAWSHTPLDVDEVDVCASIPVLISITVTDPVSMSTATAQYTYQPLENPVILNPVVDTVCASRGDHIYQSSLPGGRYYSSIIPEWLQVEGRYQFWRWAQGASINIDYVTYVAPNGCEAYDTVIILPIDVGNIQAACLNSNPFTVSNGTPVGGIWQGPHVDPGGLFSPVQSGSFVINYTAPNGCIGYKRVNVSDAIIMPDVDTICSSQEFDLTADPYGGRWSGPGIVNSIVGRIRPWTVASNQTYTYIYSLNGCSDTMDIYIQELWAGPDLEVCDSDSLLMLTQTGNWSGPAPYNAVLNAFDISMLGPGEYDFTLSLYGCADAFRLYISAPYVEPYQPISFCQEDTWILMNDIVEFYPWWGDFSGPAVVENNDQWYFNPSIAGGGLHTIQFSALGCEDSFTITVEPYAQIEEYSFCELSPAQTLSAVPPGGSWTGPGFLDGASGLFDPQLLPAGSYPIQYITPLGCLTEDTIDILLYETVSITGVNQFYCFTDTLIQVNASPSGGTFFINGIESSTSFNPTILGTGTHELFYTRGTGPCASSKRIFFSVLQAINGNVSLPDSICTGENAVIEVQSSGGSGSLTASWDQGIGFGSSHIVKPLQSTHYTVTVTDGCSEPYTGTALIHVYQPFDIEVISGPAVCYGDSTWVQIQPPDDADYAVIWMLDSLYENNYLEGQPGIYEAEVIELFSGCTQSYEVSIPGPPPLSANFTIIPNQPCVDIIDNTVQIIDLSTGYTDGWINFGDGTEPVPYVSGELIQHDYQEVGEYEIMLMVTNDLGCLDTLRRNICVENVVRVYMPNVFSPNDDGTNDAFKIEAFGVKEFTYSIFSRWGDLVFEGKSPDAFWDGNFNGQRSEPGVYAVRLVYKDFVTGERFEKLGNLTLVR